MKRKNKSTKSTKSTFLKDPFESLAVHLGKWLDQAKTEDIISAMLYGSLAYVSYEDAVRLKHPDPLKACLIGPIGLKLATTMGGTPPISQIAGLAILAGLGFIAISPDVKRPKEIDWLPIITKPLI